MTDLPARPPSRCNPTKAQPGQDRARPATRFSADFHRRVASKPVARMSQAISGTASPKRQPACRCAHAATGSSGKAGPFGTLRLEQGCRAAAHGALDPHPSRGETCCGVIAETTGGLNFLLSELNSHKQRIGDLYWQRPNSHRDLPEGRSNQEGEVSMRHSPSQSHRSPSQRWPPGQPPLQQQIGRGSPYQAGRPMLEA